MVTMVYRLKRYPLCMSMAEIGDLSPLQARLFLEEHDKHVKTRVRAAKRYKKIMPVLDVGRLLWGE